MQMEGKATEKRRVTDIHAICPLPHSVLDSQGQRSVFAVARKVW